VAGIPIPFAPRAYGRADYGLPEARCINMFVEATPSGPTDDARLPRPGMVSAASLGGNPIRGGFQQPGVFGGSTFEVCGPTAYRDGVSVGSIAGADMVRWAASGDQVVAVGGGVAHLFEGTAFATISDPDLPPVSDVGRLSSRFIYTVAGSDRFYWSEVDDAGNIDGLSFATAEGLADANVGLQVLNEDIYFFGANTVELWDPVEAETPFAARQGNRYARGCAARDSIVQTDNAVVWVGDDRIVYRADQVPQRISTHGIETRLRKCAFISMVTAFCVSIEGHAFYVLNIPGQGSFAYDESNQEWGEWASQGRATFRGQSAWTVAGTAYIGDADAGTVWAMTPGVFLDGTDPITFLASAFFPKTSGNMRCNNVVLQGARGVGLATGQGSDPIVEMRYSDDQGKTWSRWRPASLGKMGDYTRRAVWTQLGLIREPGRLFEVRCTDPVLATMSGLIINAPRPHG
jgi:hypothetical protein